MSTDKSETTDTPAETTEADVMGELSPDEMVQLNALRRAAHDYTFQVGQTEIRKARLIQMLNSTEERAQTILNAAAKRMQIPEGTAWVADPDGKVRLQPEQPGA